MAQKTAHSKTIDYSSVDLTNVNDWLPMEELAAEFSHIPFEAIRYLFHRRVEKGLDPVIKKFGKRLLGNRKGFGYWMANV